MKAPGINPVCDECVKKHDPHLFQAVQVLEAAGSGGENLIQAKQVLEASHELDLTPIARLFAAIYPGLARQYAGHEANIAANEAKWRTGPVSDEKPAVGFDLDDDIPA